MAVTVVTGASSGIGRSLARRLARDEPVALLARRAELLDTLVAEIAAAGGQARAFPCDVTDREAVRATFARLEAEMGPVTRLVANAGGGDPTFVEDFSSEHVRAALELNVMGVVHCVEAVLPGMLARGAGHLVVTSSVAGYRGLPNAGAYAASKAAVTALMESLRMGLRPRGIDVTVLAPGFVRLKPGRPKRPKPFQVPLERATERMHRAIAKRRPFDAFPLPLVALVTVGRLLPARLYDRLLGGMGPKRKAADPSTPR